MEVEKRILKEDSPDKKHDIRLGKVCLSLNKPCQERVIFLVPCELLAGCSSFAFQINCACFSLDNAAGKKVVSLSVMVNKDLLWCVLSQKENVHIVLMLHIQI